MSIESEVKKISNKITRNFKNYENTAKSLLKKLSDIRKPFYALCFYIISTNYSTDNLYISYAIIFLIISSTQVIIDWLLNKNKIKKFFTNLNNSLLITSSIILSIYITHALKFITKNLDTIINCSKTLITSKTTIFAKIITTIITISIPITGIYSIIEKYMFYKNLPEYSTEETKINIFTGKKINTYNKNINAHIPIPQILSLIVSYISSRNIVTFIQGFTEMLTIFVNYIGHKKEEMLLPTILSSLITIFTTITTYCNYIKCPLTTMSTNNKSWISNTH